MLRQALEAIGLLVAAVGLLGGAATFLIRYALLPYLESNVVKPALGKLDQISDEMSSRAAQMSDDMRAMARAYDGHLEWSQGEVDRIWRALDVINAYLEKLKKGTS